MPIAGHSWRLLVRRTETKNAMVALKKRAAAIRSGSPITNTCAAGGGWWGGSRQQRNNAAETIRFRIR